MTSKYSVWIAALLIVAWLSSGLPPNALGQEAPSGQTKAGKSSKTPTKSSTAGKSTNTGTAKKSIKSPSDNPFPRRLDSPSLEGGVGWLNTSGEITLKDLRGKVVLLDFWTYCCINCMHILPDLTYLEKKYPNELVVIGVHSGKFANEKDSENIRQAILRYEIEHPVLNDARMALWQKFNINTWPSFVLIDPEGHFCGILAGEGNRDALDRVISRVIDYHRSNGTLDEEPVRFDLESHKMAATPLRFPGKVLADEAGGRLFISDSNHNRIVVTDLDGKLLYAVGSSVMGRQDGAFTVAQFDHPQGVDLDGSLLYVADTENHLIRVVDLEKKVVRTVAGTGKQARQLSTGGKPLQTALASPWDVKKVGTKLFIAMAGFHQIWVLNGTDSVRAFAGWGKEDIINGPLNRAAFAQPSGMTTDGTNLYVVDSEGSAVRKFAVSGQGLVTTLVGTSDLQGARSLFEFGDIDGIGNQARLQHPLGIVHRKGLLYVADTYNHKIKVIDIAQRSSKTFLGASQDGAGATAGAGTPPMATPAPAAASPTGGNARSLEFAEPGGLSIAGDKLFIADTNNHRVRVYDFNTKHLATLDITGLEAPQPQTDKEVHGIDTEAMKLPAQTVAAGAHVQFQVELAIPVGFKLNKLAPVTYVLVADGAQSLIAQENIGQRDEVAASEGRAIIQIPLVGKAGSGKFQLSVTHSYCRDGVGGVCKFKKSSWTIPLTVSDKSEQKEIVLAVD